MMRELNKLHLRHDEHNSAGVLKVIKYLENELVRLRESNDIVMSEVETSILRGKISQTKKILTEIKPKTGGEL